MVVTKEIVCCLKPNKNVLYGIIGSVKAQHAQELAKLEGAVDMMPFFVSREPGSKIQNTI